ncbi:MAG: putative hydrolase or acyltransferase of alpha/beta superfamily [Acidimicrobiales bacterium]|nr:putative hydrolase or acyltransferase of alpha/beta superfamily [Acidimicrobiales bacterium]
MRFEGTPAEVVEHQVGGLRLSVAEAGRGGRPLLLVHGFTGVKEDFADWMGALADEGWWVVAPDLRGHGASDKPAEEGDYSLAIFAADLLALVDELGWGSFSLLGHSMGGMIAQELVVAAPGRLERLVLMDTCHGPVEGVDAEVVALGVDVLRTQGLPALLDLIELLQPPERSPAEEHIRSARVGYSEWADGKVRSCSPAMYAAMAQELTSRVDRLADLAALTIPVQVVVGAQDRNFVAAAQRMAAAVTTAELVVIPDAAHCPQLENPAAWWEAVAPFLATDLLVD